MDFVFLTEGGFREEGAMGGRGEFGRRAEEVACDFLRGRGYLVVCRNYRSPYGELDLVVRRGEMVVFVEVKGRTIPAFRRPSEAVDWRKRRRIARAALHYLEFSEVEGSYRFDVVEVWFDPGRGDWYLEHLEDVFGLGDIFPEFM